eukprot:TRINITY_DN1821_c0_g1_i2.p1 TRINITY_DN1821_c0_g1~~TRINITY_DN1821_c0_g1_i2.p1  ORF type:complete len:444 (+),score=190.97 TRINITY_DN1821_c0_g1_i2:62-1393(+)
MGLMNIFGLNNLSFRGAGSYVDTKLPAGRSSIEGLLWKDWMNVWKFVMESQNGLCLLLCAAVYHFFPYDYEAAARWDAAVFVSRLQLNVLIVWGFYSACHVLSNFLSSRKFLPARYPNFADMFQMVFYCTLSAVQWTVWEYGFCHMLGRGYMPFQTDAEVLMSWENIAWNAALVVAVPYIRIIHFYWCHRLIHFRFMYKYIHSLHHRNSDIDPFAGVCMHPYEILYYFTTACWPSLYVNCSPFVWMWNLFHAMITPAAPHSGFEDHWSTDQFHYIHHAKFECNYGTGAICFDKMFGTFVDKFDVNVKEQYDKENIAKGKAQYMAITDDVLNVLPKSNDYTLHWMYCIASYYWVLANALGWDATDYRVVAANLAFGPAVVAVVLMLTFGDINPLLWPFDKEPVGVCALHIAAGMLFSVVPAYHFAAGVLGGSAEATAYCQLWGC